jgi:hypothetical protein
VLSISLCRLGLRLVRCSRTSLIQRIPKHGTLSWDYKIGVLVMHVPGRTPWRNFRIRKYFLDPCFYAYATGLKSATVSDFTLALKYRISLVLLWLEILKCVIIARRTFASRPIRRDHIGCPKSYGYNPEIFVVLKRTSSSLVHTVIHELLSSAPSSPNLVHSLARIAMHDSPRTHLQSHGRDNPNKHTAFIPLIQS